MNSCIVNTARHGKRRIQADWNRYTATFTNSICRCVMAHSATSPSFLLYAFSSTDLLLDSISLTIKHEKSSIECGNTMQKDNIWPTIIPSTIITLVCIAFMIFVPCSLIVEQQHQSIILYALDYPFSHANWWHLAINLYALWYFRPRPFTCFIAFATSFLASVCLSGFGVGDYVGLSGFLFAAVARWYASWQRPIWFPVLINLLLLLLNIILPSLWKGMGVGFAWQIHLACFFASYGFWSIYYKQKRR